MPSSALQPSLPNVAHAGEKLGEHLPLHQFCRNQDRTVTANYDGKDVPVVGNPNADMVARTRVNATTTKLVSKKDGNILSTATLVVSADGKTLTITTTGKDAKGQKIDSVAVYDKQETAPILRLGATRT